MAIDTGKAARDLVCDVMSDVAFAYSVVEMSPTESRSWLYSAWNRLRELKGMIEQPGNRQENAMDDEPKLRMDEAERLKIEEAVISAVRRLGNVYFRYNDGSGETIKDLHGPEFGFDRYGTYTVTIRCGRNGARPHRSSYYFTQLAYFLDTLETDDVDAWPIKFDFDVPDDVFSATFGLRLVGRKYQDEGRRLENGMPKEKE